YVKSPCFCCLYYICCNFWTTDKSTSLSFWCHIRRWTAHININTPKSFFCHTDTHLPKTFGLISPYMCHHWLFIFRKSQTPTHTKFPLWVTITFCICKLRKKYVRSSCFTSDMSKNNICHIFHWC